MTASSKLKGRWRWRLSPRTLTPSAVQTVIVCPMIVMFRLVGSLAGGQRGKPVCWWNMSCIWQQLCRKSTVSQWSWRCHWLTEGLDRTSFLHVDACVACIENIVLWVALYCVNEHSSYYCLAVTSVCCKLSFNVLHNLCSRYCSIVASTYNARNTLNWRVDFVWHVAEFMQYK